MKHPKILFPVMILVSCTTGNNYPKKYADTICSSAFECLNEDEIDLFLGYDDIEECKESEERTMRESGNFDAFEEGDVEFNQEAAEQCLMEISEVREDADCNGNMNIIKWGVDIANEACFDIYE